MEDDPIEFRIGVFFYLMGAGAFVIFVASDFAKKADFDYFFGALVLFSIGWYFRRNLKPPPRVERFTWFKNAIQNMKQKSAPKKK
ncbi:MAG: hypothetical protein Fur002_17090 [Anaerolineales bacterium]